MNFFRAFVKQSSELETTKRELIKLRNDYCNILTEKNLYQLLLSSTQSNLARTIKDLEEKTKQLENLATVLKQKND